MTVAVQLLSVKNPNRFPLPKSSFHHSIPFPSPYPSLKFRPLLNPEAPALRVSIRNSVLPLAAFHEESKHSEIEVEKEGTDAEIQTREDWKQILDAFKLKMQALSADSYEEYYKKAVVVLRETQVQLQILSDKLQTNLSEMSKDVAEGSKEYLTTAAQNSPESVREIVDSFSSSTDDLNKISQVRDFHIGIPYGVLLFAGGFLSFMLTGSICAVRFGVILGAILLGLSIISLKSYKRGESHAGALKGQTAIATILFLRDIGLLCKSASLFTFFPTVISGAVVAFYAYRLVWPGKQTGGSDSQGYES